MAIDEKAISVGLQVNGEKTKYMLSSLRASSQERVGPKVNIGNYDFEQLHLFGNRGYERQQHHIRGQTKNHARQQMSIWLEQTNALKTNISENKGEALPPANYESFALWE